MSPFAFTPALSKVLGRHLMRISLPGLSSLDQMYLVALADTVAHSQMDFADRFAESKEGSLTNDSQADMSKATVLQRQGLKSSSLVWAFHSEATEELLSMIPCMQKGEPNWDELRQFGVGWWVTNTTILRQMTEQVAKQAFQSRKDPLDSAIFYMAMKKKNVLWGLYRSVNNQRMSDFFKHDFTQERWRKAAKKNAFALLGKQMFREAAAFFLLADSLPDAIEVLLDKLNDLQLALVVCRLYDIEDPLPASVKALLYQNILGRDANGDNYNPHRAHHDSFLRSMALWMLKDYQAALQTLLEDNLGQRKSSDDSSDPDAHSTKPNIFNFYNYLRTHPLLLRLRLASSSLKKRRAILTERQLFFATAHTHFKNGCPFLALEVLSKLPPVVETETEKEQEMANTRRMSLAEGRITTGALDVTTPMANGLPNGSGEGGKASDFDWSTPLTGTNTADSIDWSQPAASNKAEDFDWGAPLAGNTSNTADAFDWSQPLAENKAEDFDWSSPLTNRVHFEDDADLLGSSFDGEDRLNSSPKKEGGKVKFELDGEDEDEDEEEDEVDDKEETKPPEQKLDIMAQQYKFIACLKVLMEELSTLATGFEVDGGQLRYQLYIWLEKEVEVLKILCNYGMPEEQLPAQDANLDTSHDSDDEIPSSGRQRTHSQRSDVSTASLHEVILADKQDLESKERRMARRKRWLKQNSHLLRTLASYCILQGSSGGGLASVHMELLLLLQELQQERPQQQLLSPLPFPTTLPLLSASLASSRTVIADPIQYIQRLTQDLLHSVTAMVAPPGTTSNMGQVVSMRNLSVALSSCIYQCLCDSDSFYVNLARATDPGLEGFTSSMFVAPNSYLMAGILRGRHRSDSASQEVINTSPAKWPGVTSLHVLLLREKDEDSPKLQVLLCEALLAVYVSLLVTGMATFDPQILYRLLANKLDQQTWGALFGGGVKTVLKTEKNIPRLGGDPISKQRLKFNMKVMGPMKETYKEKFVSPELSMITYFMTKPFVPSSSSIISYDSDDSMDSDQVDGDDPLTDDEEEESFRPRSLLLAGQQEHCDPSSYSWCLMRFAIMRSVLNNLRTFLPQVGIEISELPIVSPMLHAVMRLLECWEGMLQARLDLFSGPPDNYIPGLALDTITGMPSSKLQALLNPENTPFGNAAATLPVKRLWFHLLRQECLQETFLRYVYRKPHHHHVDSEDESLRTGSSDEQKVPEPMKVVHKEQDIISSFAINQANESILALATQKELVELDIGLLLHPPSWLTDDNEMDIETLRNEENRSRKDSLDADKEENWLVVDVKSHKLDSKWTCTEEFKMAPVRSPMTNAAETLPEFLVVNTPQDTPQPHSGTQTPNTPYVPSPVGSVQGLQTGRGTNVNMRRSVTGVRRIGSHPTLQYYLTGSADGCVRLWEWGHGQPVTTLRQPGNFPKVTKVLFNAQGNKCCVSDVEGSICLWQVGLGSNFNKPIMSLSCHNKTTSDFTFVGCSSLIATAGHSSESKNVCLWDTLLPPRSALVHAFACHEHGSPAIIYAPQHQLLISGGRKGDICIFDLRQRALRSQINAHDSAIKCLAVDPQEEYFVTGSAEGDIKVWAMNMPSMLVMFTGEHSKNTFFRSVGSTSGVTQVAVGPNNHLFSCGVDGSIKFRQLPERDSSVVQNWT
nr:hypothetical protein BaRGS_013476 [Batillaria attramentaria]